MSTPKKGAARWIRELPRWAPHAYQKKAVKFLLEHGGAGLFLDPGLGKTSITLAAISVLKREGLFNGALVLAPLRPAQQVWPEELQGWADFADLTYCVLHGPKKEELLQQRHDIYIINYEGLRWLVGSGALKTLLKKAWVDTLVVDELSKLKWMQTQRFKLIKPLLPKFQRRWGLTGSPAANSLMNLFGETYILDCGRAFGPYITYFKRQYFLSTGTTRVQTHNRGMQEVEIGWVPKPGAEEELYAKLRPTVLRMDADDYLTLPKLLPHYHKIDLPPAARKVYDEMEEELVALLDGNLVTAANTATAMGKCRQIASGALYLHKIDPITGAPAAGGWREVHAAKLDFLEDLLDELQGQPLWCGYEFQHDIERIVKRLGKATPWIGGGVSSARAAELQRAWNANELPYLFANPQSVGHGLNLQKGNAAHVGFFTLPWDYELYDQFIRRLRRQGNAATTLHVHHIVARDTVEEYVLASLKGKRRGQQALFDALKDSLRKKRK